MCNLPEPVHFAQELSILCLIQWQDALLMKDLQKEPKLLPLADSRQSELRQRPVLVDSDSTVVAVPLGPLVVGAHDWHQGLFKTLLSRISTSRLWQRSTICRPTKFA